MKTKQNLKQQEMLAILCAHTCVFLQKAQSEYSVTGRTEHLESDWPCIYSDTVTMLKLQFLFQYNGIIITTLTVLFLSLITVMHRNMKCAFIAMV